MAKNTKATVLIPVCGCPECGSVLKWHKISEMQGEYLCSCGYRYTSPRRTCPQCGQPLTFLHKAQLDSGFEYEVWKCRDTQGCGYQGRGSEELDAQQKRLFDAEIEGYLAEADRSSAEEVRKPVTLTWLDIMELTSAKAIGSGSQSLAYLYVFNRFCYGTEETVDGVILRYAYEHGFGESLEKALDDYEQAVQQRNLTESASLKLVADLQKKYPNLPEEITF